MKDSRCSSSSSDLLVVPISTAAAHYDQKHGCRVRLRRHADARDADNELLGVFSPVRPVLPEPFCCGYVRSVQGCIRQAFGAALPTACCSAPSCHALPLRRPRIGRGTIAHAGEPLALNRGRAHAWRGVDRQFARAGRASAASRPVGGEAERANGFRCPFLCEPTARAPGPGSVKQPRSTTNLRLPENFSAREAATGIGVSGAGRSAGHTCRYQPVTLSDAEA
jgi:hypothetical protein